MNISVLIPTLDEQKNLPACLESVAWSDDIVVFDSFSSDRTLEIARQSGARVIQRKFDNERDHRTASLQVEFKHPWVYNPDADEIATPELIAEMQAVTADASRPEVAYRMRRKDMLMGRWIRRSSLYPTWLMRLYRPEAIRFERSINMRYLVNGAEGRLEHHMLHYSFNKGFESWFEKHNRYSTAEAKETVASLAEADLPLRDLASSDPVLRRRALKELSFRMPGRPLLRFFYMYLVRRGFLDGAAGFHYSMLAAFYEYMITLKIDELREGADNLEKLPVESERRANVTQ